MEESWDEPIFCGLRPSEFLVVVLERVDTADAGAGNWIFATVVIANEDGGKHVPYPFRLPKLVLPTLPAFACFLRQQKFRIKNKATYPANRTGPSRDAIFGKRE
jgi:hypothetical protein